MLRDRINLPAARKRNNVANRDAPRDARGARPGPPLPSSSYADGCPPGRFTTWEPPVSTIIDLANQDLNPLAEHARKLLAVLEQYIAWSQARGYQPGIDVEMPWWDSCHAATQLYDELKRIGFDGAEPVTDSCGRRYPFQLYAWWAHHPKVLEAPADNPSTCPDFAAALAELRLIVVPLDAGDDPEAGGGSPVGDWEFAPGRFRFRGKWHDLAGQRLALLEAFVRARHNTLTHDDIKSVCSPGYAASRAAAYVSELNSALCQLLQLRERPVKPIPSAEAYRFFLPS